MDWIDSISNKIIQRRDKSGASIISAPCLKKEYRDTPEEYIRQSFIQYAHERYGCDINTLNLEFPLTVGSGVKVRADIFWRANASNPSFIAEIKQGSLGANNETKEQLKSYMLLSQTQVGCIVDAESVMWVKLIDGKLAEIPENKIFNLNNENSKVSPSKVSPTLRWLECKSCHHVWSINISQIKDGVCPKCRWRHAYRHRDKPTSTIINNK